MECEFFCDQCQYKTTKADQLEVHIENRHSMAICNICNKTFTGKLLLIKHKNKVHNNVPNNETRKPQCSICHDLFSSKKELTKHRQMNHLTFKPCRYQENCKFGTECYYDHTPIQTDMFRCFQCGYELKPSASMHYPDILGEYDTRIRLAGPHWYSNIRLLPNIRQAAEYCRIFGSIQIFCSMHRPYWQK